MSVGDTSQAGFAAALVERAGAGTAQLRPATVFAVLSILFGAAIVALTPPLRGPDETAHFVRAYSVAQGHIVTSSIDAEGRKGTWLPEPLHDGFAFFEEIRRSEKSERFGYAQVFRKYLARPPARGETSGPEPVFVRFEGSEGYSPVAYLPQVIGAWLARGLGFDFLPTLYLMRLTGVVTVTATIACAIALAGPLGWAFLAIAMLPGALYGRSVISADGTAFAFALMAIALFLHGLRRHATTSSLERSAWQVLCALAKPPNLAFVVLELFSPADGGRAWKKRLLVVTPAVLLAIIWTLASSADVAAWRLVEIYGFDARQFDPMHKLALMLEHPLSFPDRVIATLRVIDPGEFLRQAVGVLGLFDTVLQGWTYPAIATLVLASFAAPTDFDAPARWRAALVAAVCALAYVAAIVLIFYLVWTPLDAPDIWGIQGRYFLPVLPLLAVMTAALVRGVPTGPGAALASASAVLSGWASLEAIMRTDWQY